MVWKIMEKIFIVLILFGLLFFNSCVPPSQRIEGEKLKSESAEKQFTWALNNFYAAQYDDAIREFSKLIEDYPESTLKADAQYMIGRCYFEKGQYLEVIYQLKLFVSNFPDHIRAKEANRYILEAQRKIQDTTTSQEQPLLPPTKKESQVVEKLPTDSRIKAAQILLFNCKNLDEVESEIINMRRAGVDTIIVRVFQNQGDRAFRFISPQASTGVYFKTSRAPVVADILDPITRIAHQYGVRVFAWMTTRYCDWLTTQRPELKGYEYNLETKQPQQSRGLNIFHPVVQAYLIGLYKDLARYKIDGILFQDDLILRQTEGISREADEIYFREFGKHIRFQALFQNSYLGKDGKHYLSSNDYSDEFWNWVKWKNSQLLNLAHKIMKASKSENPGLKVALNLYYETVLQPENALAWLSQDIVRAKSYGFDYYSMMAYHRQIQKELGVSSSRVLQLIGEITRKMVALLGNPESVLMKVQTIDWDTLDPVSDEELISVFNTILGEGNVSLAYVPHNHRLLGTVINQIYKSE
ncbi:MAG: hypothetical protein A2161_18120 [Candidatus Schekmanbacteria bacterium RBG_13_48_7]|uniref:Poly-beta-1,6-N-acetyl-D-glucosamine N-deacetylase PgaB C-terminal domain-containing protein n=1 Tax=Candidatus Schekmanbacteria bacterium RBG_13_48_7 TaxID=1817878 RepID=A0A1F7RQR4_9BACT|nr:MAG: hypothetical protein A2161_18120 [Candidatus Schekmanbacteria bacterium RBG_13_48_7]